MEFCRQWEGQLIKEAVFVTQARLCDGRQLQSQAEEPKKDPLLRRNHFSDSVDKQSIRIFPQRWSAQEV